MLKQHVLLKFDPKRAFASLSVGHAAEELSGLAAERSEHIFAVRQRDTAGEVQQIARVEHLFVRSRAGTEQMREYRRRRLPSGLWTSAGHRRRPPCATTLGRAPRACH